MAKNNDAWKSKEQINGWLEKGCSFEGKVMFDGTLQINGEFSGEIQSEGTLVIGQDARVSGHVQVDTLICFGAIDGKVNAKTRIEVHSPSVVTADITTKTLLIEEGSLFQGNSNMHHPSKVEEIGQFPRVGNGASASDAVRVDAVAV